MKTLLTITLTAALTSATLAGEPVASTGAARPGPVVLTEAQMDTIVAGGAQGGINSGGEFRYGGGAGADPSVYGGAIRAGAGQSGGINSGGEFRYGGGAGVDPSVHGGAIGGGVDS
jgi:hypothetical protein